MCFFNPCSAFLFLLYQNSEDLDRWVETEFIGTLPALHPSDADTGLSISSVSGH